MAEKFHICNINKLGPTTGTVFQIFANNSLDIKINTLFDTGAMKSVMSWKMYQKLKLNDLDTASIPHVVGASGENLGTRGRTKFEININGKIFYQTFVTVFRTYRLETVIVTTTRLPIGLILSHVVVDNRTWPSVSLGLCSVVSGFS